MQDVNQRAKGQSLFILFFYINNLLLNIISNNTPIYRYKHSILLQEASEAYIPFIYLIKSFFIQYYSIVLLYLLFLQYTIQYNRNPFRSYYLAVIGLISLFYVSRLILSLYFFRQVNAIVGIELTKCRTLKIGRIFGFIGSRRFTIKRQAI